MLARVAPNYADIYYLLLLIVYSLFVYIDGMLWLIVKKYK